MCTEWITKRSISSRHLISSPCAHARTAIDWSKDYGKTWAASKTVENLGECSIAFLKSAEDGEIIMNCRTGSHARAQLTWSKDGVPSEVTFPDGLIDPGCQGSIVSVASDKGTTLYLSNANTTSSRTHMAIKSSSDGGKTWDHGAPVWSGPSACQCLCCVICVIVSSIACISSLSYFTLVRLPAGFAQTGHYRHPL